MRVKARAGKRGGLTEAAYTRIKSAIIEGALPPNGVVSVNELAASYGLGVGPVRAALIRLCGEELVEVLPQHGYRILPLTLKDVLQLYDVLAVLLPSTAAFAARNPRVREQLARMRQLNALCNAPHPPASERAERAIIEAGRALSRIIAESADNRFLRQTLDSLFQQVDRVLHVWRRRAERPIDFRRDYSAVIAALGAGDPDAAARAAQAMVAASKAHIVAGILAQPGFSEVSLS